MVDGDMLKNILQKNDFLHTEESMLVLPLFTPLMKWFYGYAYPHRSNHLVRNNEYVFLITLLSIAKM